MTVRSVGIGDYLRSRAVAVASLLEGAAPSKRLELERIVTRADGLGAADQGALYDVFLDIARARAHVELRRKWLGRAGLDSERAFALEQLDDAITRAIEALSHHVGDAPLKAALSDVLREVRDRAKYRAGRTDKRGRASLPGKAALLARLVELGATTRDAHYLLTNLPPLQHR